MTRSGSGISSRTSVRSGVCIRVTGVPTGLIRFTFDGEDQDIDRFRNSSYWRDRFGDAVAPPDTPTLPSDDTGVEEATETPPTYTIDSIIDDGCFLERTKLELILDRLRSKQNLILQGPPGTGKTWLAKKLAYALIGYKDDSRVHRFQFHPNMSYEDFIRGYRPNQDGRLELVDGPFPRNLRDRPARFGWRLRNRHRGDQSRQSGADIRRDAYFAGSGQAHPGAKR